MGKNLNIKTENSEHTLSLNIGTKKSEHTVYLTTKIERSLNIQCILILRQREV